MMADPLYSEEWSRWIARLAGSLGERELAEIVYGASQHFQNRRTTARKPGEQVAEKSDDGTVAVVAKALFGDQEGRIAKANIGRDPLYFFAALQRQLNYPAVPRSSQAEADEDKKLPPFLEARLNKIEQRLKINEMEVVAHSQSLSMAFCLECHRNPETRVRDPKDVYDLNSQTIAAKAGVEAGVKFVHDWKIKPPQSCSGCHR
jgi:hypothetical protein